MAGLLLVLFCWRELLKGAVAFLILGFTLGMLPLIYYNLHALPGNKNSWSFFSKLRQAGHTALLQQVIGTITVSLPTVTGNPFCPVSDLALFGPSSPRDAALCGRACRLVAGCDCLMDSSSSACPAHPLEGTLALPHSQWLFGATPACCATVCAARATGLCWAHYANLRVQCFIRMVAINPLALFDRRVDCRPRRYLPALAGRRCWHIPTYHETQADQRYPLRRRPARNRRMPVDWHDWRDDRGACGGGAEPAARCIDTQSRPDWR